MTKDWEEAIVQGDADRVSLLLAQGADVDSRDSHGQTGLMRAALKAYESLTSLILGGKTPW